MAATSRKRKMTSRSTAASILLGILLHGVEQDYFFAHSFGLTRFQHQQHVPVPSFHTSFRRRLSCLSSTETSTANTPKSDQVINPTVANIAMSKTIEIFSLVKQMESQNISVTSLCVGEPDFPPPQPVLQAASQAILEGDTRYTAVTGTADLRQAIATDLQQRKHVEYDANTEIVVANGAKQAIYQAVLATVKEGDVVLVPAPYWPSYPAMVELVQGVPVVLETNGKDDGFLLTPEALRTALEEYGEKVKMIILCNPSNPSGMVYTKAQLQSLAEVLEDYPQVLVLADEIYERLVYTTSEDPPHTAFATLPNMYHRTLTINGFSKAYAMTGFRLGYLAAPKILAAACTKVQSQLTSCASSISQAAGVAALTEVDDQELEENNKVLKERRDYVVSELQTMKGVKLFGVPQGAFYIFPSVADFYNGDDVQLCKDLLQSEKLALVPGTAFGCKGTVRISYATSMDELKVAMAKLRKFLEECNM